MILTGVMPNLKHIILSVFWFISPASCVCSSDASDNNKQFLTFLGTLWAECVTSWSFFNRKNMGCSWSESSGAAQCEGQGTAKVWHWYMTWVSETLLMFNWPESCGWQSVDSHSRKLKKTILCLWRQQHSLDYQQLRAPSEKEEGRVFPAQPCPTKRRTVNSVFNLTVIQWKLIIINMEVLKAVYFA